MITKKDMLLALPDTDLIAEVLSYDLDMQDRDGFLRAQLWLNGWPNRSLQPGQRAFALKVRKREREKEKKQMEDDKKTMTVRKLGVPDVLSEDSLKAALLRKPKLVRR